MKAKGLSGVQARHKLLRTSHTLFNFFPNGRTNFKTRGYHQSLPLCPTIFCLFFTVVKTKSGKVRGQIQPSSIQGKSVQKFLNIPYAEAPIGQLRFEKPQPKKPWNGNIAIIHFSYQKLFHKSGNDYYDLTVFTGTS